MTNLNLCEYLWIDGTEPTAQIRSKAKTVNLKNPDNPQLQDFSEWSFDGSSTNQAEGTDSDCILKPVNFVNDPERGEGSFLVMCEVFNSDGTEHKSNSRAKLRKTLDAGAKNANPWVGFEQEYVMLSENRILGWPKEGEPGEQGPYYCGAGAEKVAGRDLVEYHAELCLEAGLLFYGINAEVMLGQWEFQIGYRGVAGEDAGALNAADHLWLSRYLLSRAGEKFDISVTFENKPMKGCWNGSGMHTNFSTDATRNKSNGRAAIDAAIKALAATHAKHIKVYGHALDERLTGEYETSDIHSFSAGAADRGSSIRIPKPVEINGHGYFEDRRPGANADPYEVANALCESVCLGENFQQNAA
jgi:glutamine synthetase